MSEEKRPKVTVSIRVPADLLARVDRVLGVRTRTAFALEALELLAQACGSRVFVETFEAVIPTTPTDESLVDTSRTPFQGTRSQTRSMQVEPRFKAKHGG